jgi:hypothetical protein
MSYKEAYNIRIGILPLYGAFIKEVIDNHGLDTALKYHRNAVLRDCNIMMKGYDSEKLLEPSEARDNLQQMNSNGVDSRVELVGNEVISHNKRCPSYDGWIAGGLTPEQVELFCRTGFKVYEEKMWQVQNPNIQLELRKFKQEPEDTCEEVLIFKQ